VGVGGGGILGVPRGGTGEQLAFVVLGATGKIDGLDQGYNFFPKLLFIVLKFQKK
jgi:hypothetical protein